MTRPARWSDTLGLNAYWLGLGFMWNALHPILLPMVLLGLVEQGKNTAYGLLTFAGLMIALIVQPLSGALSDRTRHPLGRRRPWMLLGSGLSALCLLALVVAPSLGWVAVAYLSLQVFSNMAHGPAQGLIPDLVPVGRHGQASGQKSLMDMLGILLAALVIGRIMGRSPAGAFISVGVIIFVLWASTSVTAWAAHEARTAAPTAPALPHSQLVRPDLRRYPAYRRLLASRFCVLLSSYCVQSFALYYVRDVLHAPSPAEAVGSMMTVVGATMLIVVAPAGALAERWGRKRLSVGACAISAVGMGSLALCQEVGQIYPLAAFIGLGMGVFASVNWAWATHLAPANEAGKYLGLSNLATAGSAAVARLLGPAIDLANSWSPNTGYLSLFALAALSATVGLVITLSIPEKAP